METKEYRTVDKSTWPEGPWQNEPDKRQWMDEATGYPCLIVRGPSGSLCGYVGVPEGHQDYQKGYDHVPVEVHGGLTFAEHCQHGDEGRGICHIPVPGEPDNVWWLGFDCAHLGDISPAHEPIRKRLGLSTTRPSRFDETYKDVAYVEDEVKQLAKQLKDRA